VPHSNQKKPGHKSAPAGSQTAIPIPANLSNLPPATDSSAGKECYGPGGWCSRHAHPSLPDLVRPGCNAARHRTRRHNSLYSLRGTVQSGEVKGGKGTDSYAARVSTGVQRACRPPAAPACTHSSSSGPSCCDTLPMHTAPSTRALEACMHTTRMPRPTSRLLCPKATKKNRPKLRYGPTSAGVPPKPLCAQPKAETAVATVSNSHQEHTWHMCAGEQHYTCATGPHRSPRTQGHANAPHQHTRHYH
jgi:hypothetical protein